MSKVDAELYQALKGEANASSNKPLESSFGL
jgi:hypothetical protein